MMPRCWKYNDSYINVIFVLLCLALVALPCDGKINISKDKLNKSQRLKDEENIKINLQKRDPKLYTEVYQYLFYPRGEIYEYLQNLSPKDTDHKQITRALKRINASVELLAKYDELKDEEKEIMYNKVYKLLRESSGILEEYNLEYEIELAIPYCSVLHKSLVVDFDKKEQCAAVLRTEKGEEPTDEHTDVVTYCGIVWEYCKDTHYYDTTFAAGFTIASAADTKEGTKLLGDLFKIADSRLDFLAEYK